MPAWARTAASKPSAEARAGFRTLQLAPSPRKAQTPKLWLPARPRAETIFSSSRPRSLPQAAAAPKVPAVAVTCQPLFRWLETPKAMPMRDMVSYPQSTARRNSSPVRPRYSARLQAAGTTTVPMWVLELVWTSSSSRVWPIMALRNTAVEMGAFFPWPQTVTVPSFPAISR